MDKVFSIVDTCVDKGSSCCLSHVVCECLPDVTECSNMKVRRSANIRSMVIHSKTIVT